MTSPALETAPGSLKRHSWGYYAGLGIMSIFYLASGVYHFRSPQGYVAIMPPYVPFPLAIVYISGAAELLGGLGVLIPDGFVFSRTRAAAARGLVALLVAILPVHINMCVRPEQFPQIPLLIIWLRLPLQLPLIAWAWYYTRK